MYTESCGCTVTIIADKLAEDYIKVISIQYCPLHKSAKDLYEALKGLHDYLTTPLTYSDKVGDLIAHREKATKALAKVEA